MRTRKTTNHDERYGSGRRKTSISTVMGSGALAGFALWRAAMAWQRGVDRALRPLGLTHTQALVLSALDVTFKRTDEAVSQSAIAAEAGLDKVTVSTVLRTLDSRGYISRDIAFGDKRVWRIAPTQKGERVLASAVPLLEEASSVLPQRRR